MAAIRPIFNRHSSRCDELSTCQTKLPRAPFHRLSAIPGLRKTASPPSRVLRIHNKMRLTRSKHAFSRPVPVICGLLLSFALVGCQHQQASTPLSRRHELLQLGAQNSQPADDQSEEPSVVSAESNGTEGKTAANSGSRWASWFEHLPRPPRIPLPRTDMGGSDIAVLETRTASAGADSR